MACSWQRQSGALGGVFFERREVDSGHVVAVLICNGSGEAPRPGAGDPCMQCLMEVLRIWVKTCLWLAAKAGGDGAVMRRSLLEGIAKGKFKTAIWYLQGKP